MRGELKKEHAEHLRERLAEKEDQLRERLEEKDAHINSHLKQISDLQQQLKVTPFSVYSVHTQSLDMFFPFQLAVEMNAQSLLQYKQLAELQEARMEREREKIAIKSELMAVTR